VAREAFFRKFEETENLTEEMLLEIEDFARGMELDEIYEYFGIDDPEEFTEDERKWIDKTFKRGRAKGKKAAVDSLFETMKTRGGQNASLPYLKAFAEEFKNSDEPLQNGDVLIFRANK